MGLGSWFKAKKRLIEENSRLRGERAILAMQLASLQALLDKLKDQMRDTVDRAALASAFVQVERDTLKAERDAALAELRELKRTLRKSEMN